MVAADAQYIALLFLNMAGFGAGNILLVHQGHQHIPTPKHQAPKTIGVFEQIKRLSVGPVIAGSGFRQISRHTKNQQKYQQITPTHRFAMLLLLRNSFIAEIGNNTR